MCVIQKELQAIKNILDRPTQSVLLAKKMHPLIENLRTNNWVVIQAEDCELVSEVRERYPDIPDHYLKFIDGIESCCSEDEKEWFLFSSDFNETSDSAFKWNEFELQSLEVADGDEEWEKEIKGFWDVHIPIYLSVKNGYEYAAISLKQESFGQIVMGHEPEYEETTIIANSLHGFVQKIG